MHHARYEPVQELHRIYQNAASEYKLYVRQQDFSTLTQLNQLAVEYETVMRQRAEYSGSRAGSQVVASSSSAEWERTVQPPGGHLNPFRTTPTSDPERLFVDRQALAPPATDPAQVAHRMMNQEAGTGYDPRRACPRCAQEGHYARECPNAPVLFCWVCGHRGRSIQDCCRRTEA
nr:uncharacterized protein LOC116650455 [Drosophila virilis]XP_032296481.1 uncharacterized protein LOC116652284 [Drosophila virilis]